MTATVSAPRWEHLRDPLGITVPKPRLSWTVEAGPGWRQLAFEIEEIRGDERRTSGRIDGDDQVLVDWPFPPLASRDRSAVRVRVWSANDSSDWSPWSVGEAGLQDSNEWTAVAVAAAWDRMPEDGAAPPILRRAFIVDGAVRRARLYVTAHGVTELELNGLRVGDVELTPGWTSYDSRLRVATFDVTDLVVTGENVIGAWLADGWYRGRLGFDGGTRNLYGDQLALLAQLEIELVDGRRVVVGTDQSWLASTGPIARSGLYDGEHHDARLERPGWSGGPEAGAFSAEGWTSVELVPFDTSVLVGPDGPPVRCTQELAPVSVEALPGGGHLLDFGQNLVGRLRVRPRGPRGARIDLYHAEVLQEGRLYRRPLREAAAHDVLILAGTGAVEEWEPRFTTHGFRYAEVHGWTGDDIGRSVTARVIHSDLERTGWFACSDERVTRLHENVVWSMRGNIVDLPTDCPQRDERLGWTGDIQVFTPTASFLYDCAGFLSSWLQDLAVEQLPDGTVPWYVPVIPGGPMWTPIRPGAAWGDAAVLVPWGLWRRFRDRELLRRQYDSAKRWVELVERLSGDDHLWNTGFQLGDWLDPAAPPDDPAAGKTDPSLVATAYAAESARRLADIADVLDEEADARRFRALAEDITTAFRAEYIDADGRLRNDTATAWSLAIAFELLSPSEIPAAGAHLAALVAAAGHTISTGFAGTNLLSEALSRAGQSATAYRLLLNETSPSWLYALTMGATTIWERWDSMLPDGSVNSGGMTSFNHYALGAVADWLHRRVAGLEPLAPGYRVIGFRPEPGGGLTWASARHVTPYGAASIDWRIEGDELVVDIEVPPGATGVAELPGAELVQLGSGRHLLSTVLSDASDEGR